MASKKKTANKAKKKSVKKTAKKTVKKQAPQLLWVAIRFQ